MWPGQVPVQGVLVDTGLLFISTGNKAGFEVLKTAIRDELCLEDLLGIKGSRGYRFLDGYHSAVAAQRVKFDIDYVLPSFGMVHLYDRLVRERVAKIDITNIIVFVNGFNQETRASRSLQDGFYQARVW
jgi:hypothetical protein